MASVIQTLMQRISAEVRIQSLFENLVPGSFKKTSDVSGRYNCIAHAAYDCRRKWWPIQPQFVDTDRYWPKSVKPRRTITAFTKAFAIEGYELCDNGDVEPGYEKVALYVSDKPTIENPLDAPTHMARQLPCGQWTSKLGEDIDIVHDTPERLVGKEYGRIARYLRRRRIPVTLMAVVTTNETKATQDQE